MRGVPLIMALGSLASQLGLQEEAGTLVHVQVPSNDHAPGIVHHHFV